MANEAKEKKQKTKRPTPIKRDLQNEKRRLINRSFKSTVRTVVRAFEGALESKDQTQIQERLKAFYSAMDQGAKRGIFKKNKADRLKSRAYQKTVAA